MKLIKKTMRVETTKEIVVGFETDIGWYSSPSALAEGDSYFNSWEPISVGTKCPKWLHKLMLDTFGTPSTGTIPVYKLTVEKISDHR